MLYSGITKCCVVVKYGQATTTKFACGKQPIRQKGEEMQGCLILLVIVVVLLVYGPAIAAMITAAITLAVAWVLVTAGLLAPTWLTSHFLAKFSEENSDERYILSLAHAFLYGLCGLAVVILLAFDLLTTKGGVKGSIDILSCLVGIWFFGAAAYVATKIVLGVKPSLGRTAQSALAVVAAVVLIVAFWGGAIYKFQTWGACQQQAQWLTNGVDLKTAEIVGNDKVVFVFQNHLPSSTEIRADIGAYSRRAEPFICPPGECRIELSQLKVEDIDGRWQINIATDKLSAARNLFDFYLPYSIVYGKRKGEDTIYQVTNGYCDFLTLQEKNTYEARGLITRQ